MHSPSEDQVTIDPQASAAARRYWEAREKGRAVAVDEVLETTPGSAAHMATRATLIQLISSQAAKLSDQGDASQAERHTLASSLGLSSASTFTEGGPLPTIDDYDIVSCLGRGGMGAVFEGYQRSTGRRVAIKFMLDRLGASHAARARFEREVEVVARLQHPGIVSVLDSGVRKGQYYFVMEYVSGQTLEAAMPPGKCDVRPAVEVMAKVCDAIDYAHQRGVLHRDLKPINILIDASVTPHVLDFGLAKVFDPAESDGGTHGAMGLTISGPGQLMGTLAYMSPEQARGEHDQTSVRTDVYALAAITYHIVSGRLPCVMTSSVPDSLGRILNEPPAAPSSIRRGLAYDLDAILLKGLEKAPERRYATAGELAADLRRYLAGQSVLARRVSPAGRALRWVARNRTISAVIAAAALTLAVVSAVLVNRIVRERDLARSNFELVKSILESADPDRFSGVVQLLDGASERLKKSPPQQDMAEAEIRQLVGSVYTRFGEYTKARANHERVLAIRQQHASGDDAGVADALHNLAAALWWEGQYDQAEPLYARSLAMRQRLHPGDNTAVAFSLTHLAACRLRMGKLDDARELYEQALAMRTRLYGAEHEEVAQSLNNLAKCDLEAERFDRAESLFSRSLEMIRKVKGDAHSGTAAASQNLGDCLLRRAEAAAVADQTELSQTCAATAFGHFTRSLEIRTRIYPQGHHLVAMSLVSQARAEILLGQAPSARAHALQALEMLGKTRPPSHPDVGEAKEAIGLAMLASADTPPREAIAPLRQALDIAIHAKPPSELVIARVRESLARALLADSQPEEAESLLASSLETYRRRRGDSAPSSRHAARLLMSLYHARGNTEAEEGLRALAKPD